MRNVWKGLVVGGLTGVTAGIVLDSITRASTKAVELGGQVRGHAPEAGRWVQSVTGKAGGWLHDADVPEHVRSAAHRVKDSEAVHRVADAGTEMATAAKEAASRGA